MKLVRESLLEIKGGKGDKLTAKDVCPKQLEIGKAVEKEHASSRKTPEEIALDHLAEKDKYYSELEGKPEAMKKLAIYLNGFKL